MNVVICETNKMIDAEIINLAELPQILQIHDFFDIIALPF